MSLTGQDFTMTQGEKRTLRYTLNTGDVTNLTGGVITFRAGTRGTAAVLEKVGSINQASGPPILDVVLLNADTSGIPGSEYDTTVEVAFAGEPTELATGKMTLNENILAP